MQQLNILAERFDASAQAFPEIRRAVLEKAGQELRRSVRRGVSGSGVKVRYWQELHMGSGGGYSAVRPRAKESYRGYAVGYITNAINSGHKTRGGGGRVPGQYFYQRAEPDAVRLVNAARDEITRRLAEQLED